MSRAGGVETGGKRVRPQRSIVHTHEGDRHPSDHFPVTAVVEWP
jgi:endonuclease/exonuclease/phosphatase family metal-dependent hydrolase